MVTILNVDVCQTLAELKGYYLMIKGKTMSEMTERDKIIFTEYLSQRDGNGDGKISWPEMWSIERTRKGSLVQMILKTQKEREQKELEKLKKKVLKRILNMDKEKAQTEKEKMILNEQEKQAMLARRKRWRAWDEFNSYEEEDALRKIFNEHVEASEQVTHLVYCLSLILFNIGDSERLVEILGFDLSPVTEEPTSVTC